jgi:uncharacterized protein YodC (DUF2158 family)
MQEVKVGDQVRLLSGGPTMTVYGFTEEGTVACCWFASETAPALSLANLLKEILVEATTPATESSRRRSGKRRPSR